MAKEIKGLYQKRPAVRYSFTYCKKCGKEFENGDPITTVRIRTKNSFRTEIYHDECWNKKLY